MLDTCGGACYNKLIHWKNWRRSEGCISWLVLGNPGRKYEHTRHNVGFDVTEILSQKYDIPIRKLMCKAAVGEGTIRGERVVIAQPQTFMNLSRRECRSAAELVQS